MSDGEHDGSTGSDRRSNPLGSIRRPQLLWWRVTLLLLIAAFVLLWIRSWTRQDFHFQEFGNYWTSFGCAASCLALTAEDTRYPTSPTGISALGPIKDTLLESGEVPGELRLKLGWLEEQFAGYAIFEVPDEPSETEHYPNVYRLSKLGSFSIRTEGKPLRVVHLRFPILLVVAMLVAWWIRIEHSARRRRLVQS